MLRLVLPKGSLERATMQLFEDADLAVNRASDVAYRASIDDPRIDEVRILRPQEIPVYVADGLFDLGITGRDCIEERGSEVVSLGELAYSKATSNPARIVLAVGADSPATTLAELAKSVADRPGRLRVSTEYPELTRRALEAHGIDAEIALSYGATEAKVPDIADAVVDMTETGSALRAAGLKVIETLLVSHTELIANPKAADDPDKRHAMEQILTLLQGTLEARGKVLVKLNVSAENLDAVLAVLPSMRAPTISELSGGGAFALETVVPRPTSTCSSRHCAIRAPRTSSSSRSPRSSTDVAAPVATTGPHLGRVASFDATRGPRHRRPTTTGTSYAFHATAIADGSRRIDVGTTRESSPVAPGHARPSTRRDDVADARRPVLRRGSTPSPPAPRVTLGERLECGVDPGAVAGGQAGRAAARGSPPARAGCASAPASAGTPSVRGQRDVRVEPVLDVALEQAAGSLGRPAAPGRRARRRDARSRPARDRRRRTTSAG